MSDSPDESSHEESMEGIITALLIQMQVPRWICEVEQLVSILASKHVGSLVLFPDRLYVSRPRPAAHHSAASP